MQHKKLCTTTFPVGERELKGHMCTCMHMMMQIETRQRCSVHFALAGLSICQQAWFRHGLNVRANVFRIFGPD